jgi:hypothetical protein
MAVNCDRRITSTSAPQSLMLMNSEFVVAQAAALAERLRRETPEGFGKEIIEAVPRPNDGAARDPLPGKLPAMIANAWEIAYLRKISPEEFAVASAFCAEQLAHQKSVAPAADHELAVLTNLCQQLLDSNEFLYVD